MSSPCRLKVAEAPFLELLKRRRADGLRSTLFAPYTLVPYPKYGFPDGIPGSTVGVNGLPASSCDSHADTTESARSAAL